MTPEAQQLAIAEARGLSDISKIGEQLMHGGTGIFLNIPDYLNDLNAMHEAEKILTHDQADSFTEFLWSQNADNVLVDSYIWHATAAQRAEALLKALNLWKETSK
jgi:hypothetical protein